jgi:hypothetical protein
VCKFALVRKLNLASAYRDERSKRAIEILSLQRAPRATVDQIGQGLNLKAKIRTGQNTIGGGYIQ